MWRAATAVTEARRQARALMRWVGVKRSRIPDGGCGRRREAEEDEEADDARSSGEEAHLSARRKDEGEMRGRCDGGVSRRAGAHPESHLPAKVAVACVQLVVARTVAELSLIHI